MPGQYITAFRLLSLLLRVTTEKIVLQGGKQPQPIPCEVKTNIGHPFQTQQPIQHITQQLKSIINLDSSITLETIAFEETPQKKVADTHL